MKGSTIIRLILLTVVVTPRLYADYAKKNPRPDLCN